MHVICDSEMQRISCVTVRCNACDVRQCTAAAALKQQAHNSMHNGRTLFALLLTHAAGCRLGRLPL